MTFENFDRPTSEVVDHIFDQLHIQYPSHKSIQSAVRIDPKQLRTIIERLAKSGWPILPPLELVFQALSRKRSGGSLTMLDLEQAIVAHVVAFDQIKGTLLAFAGTIQRNPEPLAATG